MSDKPKNEEKKVTEEDVFEILELAIDDIETLTAAFSLISDVCEDLQNPIQDIEEELDGVTIH
ncbi:MAG: hypothetical protein KDD62_03460 [Bdellovibrionales bacterium]|nr:hypothetical protein [Bdellovibrionales bacterium]